MALLLAIAACKQLCASLGAARRLAVDLPPQSGGLCLALAEANFPGSH